MKKKISLILILACFIFSCKSDNKTKQSITYTRVTRTKNYSSQINVDRLPILVYKKMTRQIQPYDNRLIKDSLLSVFLEENIRRQISVEGIFYYNINISIDSDGIIKDIEFQEDEYKSDELKKNIKIEIFNTKLIPAQRAGKNVPVRILVRICLDLYNGQSDINKRLFDKSNAKQ
jgi:thioredoxin-related protein